MKRLVATITLIILLAVETITPVTYAVEDFSDVEIVEEIVEETIQELEEDEDSEDNEINEESDEESDSVDEDDLENGDTETEEETAESDELSDETDENENIENENSEPEENEENAGEEIDYSKYRKESRVAVLAEKLGIDRENEKEYYAKLAGVEGEYKGTRWQNEAIRVYLVDHLEEILNNRNLSGDISDGIENLSGLNIIESELTWELVDELIENQTGVFEDYLLNSEVISGTKTYDNVTVNVQAPKGSFYSGTTLEIEPIKWFSLRSLKNQLVEEKEEITKDSTIVAFNISFIYSGEEVQPLSGKTVSVTFNYENNEDIKQAEEDKNQEVTIYHINEKDEEGNKLEEKEIEKIDIVENNEGEIVVEAESFSIYTIVTQVAEEGPLADNENQLANFVYGEISIPRPDKLSSIDYPIEGFTIMDRNLGAITTGAGDSASTGSYGFHYQWGNNYGFDANIDPSELTTGSIKVNVLGLTGYYSKTFIKGSKSDDTWMKSNNNNLWNGEQKQGPCPEGWHIPSKDDWNKLLIYWAETNSINWTNNDAVNLGSRYLKIFEDLYIPYAGIRNYDGSFLNRGILGDFWTYSVKNENKAYSFFTAKTVDKGSNTYLRYSDGRVRGLSIRCFKNEYSGTGNMFTITYDFRGGSGSVVNQMVKSGEVAERPTNPIKSGYNFKGWYISGTNTLYDFTEKVTESKTLYAKYREICGEGYVSDGEQCVVENNVSYLIQGNNFKTTLLGLSSVNNIVEIKRSNQLPGENITNTGNVAQSGLPVIVWFEDVGGTGTIFYYTEATTIFLNSYSSNMFNGFSKLKYLDVVGFNTSKVIDMNSMFAGCNSLIELDVSNWNTSKVENMRYMFSNLNQLKSLDLSNWDTSSVTNMEYMFYNSNKLETLNVNGFNTSKVEKMNFMFSHCESLTSIDVSNFDTKKVDNMTAMFSNLGELNELNLGNFVTSGVTSMNSMFAGCEKLIELDLSNFDTSKVTDMNSMFAGCSSLTNLNVSSFVTSGVTNMRYMFAKLHSLQSLDISNIDTSSVTNMEYMFYNSNKLETLNVNGFNTSKVEKMNSMFEGCNSLTSLDVSNFDTKKVDNMTAMFSNLRELNELNLGNFVTSGVTNMNSMFNGCEKLIELDLSNFDTSKVTNMNSMFAGCSSLTNLNVSNFDTSKVENMRYMFANMNNLGSLDISNFDTNHVTNMEYMFHNLPNLKTIYASGSFSTDIVTSSNNMLSSLDSIVGGNGTKYDSTKKDKTYAQIDNENQSGYFTDSSHFKVNFKSITGVLLTGQRISSGETITPLEDNTKDYTYYKSYTDPINNEIFVTGTQLYSYTEIFVEYINKYKVEFNTMGGTPLVEPQRIIGGGTATGIEESLLPKKKKYIFEGWYETGATEPFDFENTLITGNLTLYAKWKEKLCVTYSAYGDGIRITGLESDNDCKENLVIPNKIEGKRVNSISETAFTNKGLTGTLTFQTPSEIKYIGYAAFRNNNLTGSLILPEGLISIQNHTFYGNNFNGELVIPSGVVSIGETSFYGNKFSGLTLNEGLQSIGGGAFDNMRTLQGNLKIPSTVTSIGSTAFSSAFDKNYQNNTLELSENINSIGYAAFRNNNLTGSLILPEKLTIIQNHTFYGNKFNGTLYIPSGINRIGETAFFENNLSKVVFYTGGEISIGTNAFCGNGGDVLGYRNGVILNPENPDCMSLEDYLELKVTFDAQVEGSGTWETLVKYGNTLENPRIISGDNILKWHEEGTDTEFDFENTPITEDITLYGERGEYGVENICFKTSNLGNGKISIIGFKDSAPDSCKINPTIPDRIIGLGWVTEIGYTAFYNLNSLSGELKIPGTVEVIGPGAFREAFDKSKNNTLKLGTGIRDIQFNAFRDSGLTGQLILPESVISIGNSAFRNNNFNGVLKIPSGITSISDYSFYGNNFVGIDFGNANIKEILYAAFYNMNSLSGELKIPDTVEVIGTGAFRNAFDKSKNNTLKLGTGIRDIHYNAFLDSGLTGGLILPESVTNIGKSAFQNNNFIGDLIIPESVISIGDSAFYGNKFNGLLKLSSNLTTIEASTFRQNEIEKIDFNGAKLVGIGYTAFYLNSLSGELKIPDTVEIIGPGAFRNAFNQNITSALKLGVGIKDIQYNAFMENHFVGDIVFPENIENIGSQAFSFNDINRIYFKSTGNVSIGGSAFCRNGNVVGYQNLANISAENQDCITWLGKYPYTISHITYGGEPSSDETVLYGNTITNTSPIKTGYEFKGRYLTGDIPFNNNTPITGDLTLYAKFQKDIIFTINGNGNKILSGSHELDEYIVTGTVFNNDYEYAFTFPEIKENDDTPITIGYSTGADIYNGIYQAGDSITLTGSQTFYGQTKQQYSNHKGLFISGTGVDSLGTTNQHQINIYCTPEPTYNGNRNDSCIIHSPIINLKPGYNNARYYIGLNVYNQDTDIIISNDNTFTAIGDMLTYNINYILNSGNLAEQKLTYTTEEGFSIDNPIRTGYEFMGWTGTTLTEITKNLYINTGTYGDLTLYANWSPNTYTVLFHSNTGADETLAEIFTYDEGEKALTKNEFINTGYIFKGWNTEKSGTGISYEDEQQISNLTSVNNTTINLYAQWNKLTKVEFKDGDALITGYLAESGTQIEVPDVLNKDGYEFIKWNGLPEDMIVRGEDLIITAEWKSIMPDESQPLTPSAGGGRIIDTNNSIDHEHNSADSEQIGGDNVQGDEEQSLYKWAYTHNITTLPTQQRADPDGVVIRGHLAKMLVNYMINVKGEKLPDEIPSECKWNDNESVWESQEIKDYAEKACALGVMGINTNIFDPNGLVSRAQFGTTLSRILWGDKYNVEDTSNIPYYEKHLEALKENKILEKTDNPEKTIEIRKWIWMMLRRTKEMKQ